MKTVVAFFEGADEARQALQDLKREGLNEAQAFGTSSGGNTKVTNELTSAGVPSDEAARYADEVRRGGSLVMVRTDDSKSRRAVEILERHGTSGAHAGVQSRTGATGTKGTSGGTARSPGRGAGEIREQEVQEDVQIGKRAVERRGVRISTHISEQPVEKQVHLRDEKVNVEHRAVDRPASEADLRKGDREFVVTERIEEPVVQKQARVTGEVVVSKQAQERTQTVRDTVRRKEVHVDREPGATSPDHTQYDAEFREHHRKHDKSGLDYDDAAPAYNFGMNLSQSPKTRGKDWSSIRSQIRTDWEEYNPDTFDEAEPAIKYGWEKGAGKK